jgi:hypothetical protein
VPLEDQLNLYLGIPLAAFDFTNPQLPQVFSPVPEHSPVGGATTNGPALETWTLGFPIDQFTSPATPIPEPRPFTVILPLIAGIIYSARIMKRLCAARLVEGHP